MKKVFVVACLSVFVLASCKKEYTCSCKVGSVSVDVVLEKQSKKDAKVVCDQGDSVLSACELK